MIAIDHDSRHEQRPTTHLQLAAVEAQKQQQRPQIVLFVELVCSVVDDLNE